MTFPPRYLAFLVLLLAGTFSHAQQNVDGQLPIADYDNPTVLLLRDDEVLRELRVDDQQRESLARLADQTDAIIWPARNQPTERARAAWTEATVAAQLEAVRTLTPVQRQRLEEIILWIQGTRSLMREDVAEVLSLTPKQRAAIQAESEAARAAIAELAQRAAAGEDAEPLHELARQRRAAEQIQLVGILSDDQRHHWVQLLGPRIDVAKLGFVSFRAPTLIATDEDWLTRPAALDHQKRRVTAIHFFANGCVNCQRNYEHYLAWDESFREQGLVIIGIHTPETEEECDLELLKRRVTDAGFRFPILVDMDRKNWDAWGNSMWPTVYLVDRHGRIRAWWQGELNWQSAKGEARMRERIAELLAESDDPEASQ